jgi:glycerol uptake facilitator-like aquaporin
MKFAERAMIILCLIGYYLAVWRKPADISVVFVGGGLLSILYIVGMPFLLGDISIRQLIRKEHATTLQWHHWLIGVLFGILSAYCVFSLIYNSLGQMDSLALAENCDLGLLIFASVAGWGYKKQPQLYYRNLLIRAGIIAGMIIVSVCLHTMFS